MPSKLSYASKPLRRELARRSRDTACTAPLLRLSTAGTRLVLAENTPRCGRAATERVTGPTRGSRCRKRITNIAPWNAARALGDTPESESTYPWWGRSDRWRREVEGVIWEDPSKPLSSTAMHRWWYRCLQNTGVVERGVTADSPMHESRHTAITDVSPRRREPQTCSAARSTHLDSNHSGHLWAPG